MASKRDKIRLISSANTGHFYTTDKNKKNTPAKMEIKKYDPVVRKHVMYKDGKIKYGPATCSTSTKPAAWRASSFPGYRTALFPTPVAAAWIHADMRTKSIVQFVSQMLPPSAEKACSHRAASASRSVHVKRTLIGISSNVSSA